MDQHINYKSYQECLEIGLMSKCDYSHAIQCEIEYLGYCHDCQVGNDIKTGFLIDNDNMIEINEMICSDCISGSNWIECHEDERFRLPTNYDKWTETILFILWNCDQKLLELPNDKRKCQGMPLTRYKQFHRIRQMYDRKGN